MGPMPTEDASRYEFYSAQYARFGSAAAAEVRREAYGNDLGQQGWRTLAEQDVIVDLVNRTKARRLLDIACGSGGPSLDFVARTDCHVTGVDIEPEGIAQAVERALAMRLESRTDFTVANCDAPLPYPDAEFDMVVCIDAVIHLRDRLTTLRDWFRLLRPGGILILTDAAVLTGPVSKLELDVRASQGSFVIVPPGVNERSLEEAGFKLLSSDDTTRETAEIASRLHAAREERAAALKAEEGSDWFAKRQIFLSTTANLAVSGRLSRFRYLAKKPT
jgi:ubiquinone/menaquinone biosynthesis C-methylase UbiE